MFEGTNKVYIGQSINIEKRLKQHIAKLIDGTAVLNMLAGRAKYTKGWKILCQDASQ